MHCTARGVSVLPRNQSNSTYAVAKCTIFLPAICPRPLKGSQPNSPHRSQMDWNRKHGVKIMKCAGGQVVGGKNGRTRVWQMDCNRKRMPETAFS